MRTFCAVDPEGQIGKTGLIGCAFYSDAHQTYLTDHGEIRTLLRWHAAKHYTFVSHNAEHDLSLLFWGLDLPATAVYFNRTFNRGEWKHGHNRASVQLWDTVELSGGLSLAALGDSLGLPKYAMPQLLRGVDPDRYAWRCDAHGRGECVECYALRDAEIVYRYVEHLTDFLAIWQVPPAHRLSALAMAIWKSLDHPNHIRIADGRCRYLGRQAYWGARVECFKLGRFRPLYGADIESCYPAMMAQTLFPDPAEQVHVYALEPDRVPWHHEGAAECEVIVPPMSIPPLPYEHAGYRVFPVGRLRGFWTFLELRHAMSLGCEITRVHRATYSLRSISPFALTVPSLWHLRQQYRAKHDPREVVAKALLNHLYGRFGMRPQLWEERITLLGPDAERGSRRDANYHRENGRLFEHRERPVYFDHSWVNELWAAQIAAAARVHLHQLLLLQGDALVYCDTDGIYSMAPIQGLGEGLGALSGHTTYLEGTIAGPKLYSLTEISGDAKLRASGIKRDLAAAFLRGEEVVWEQPLTPRQMVRGEGEAGVWVPVHRERGLQLHRRTPINPAVLQSEWGWSDTVPPAVS